MSLNLTERDVAALAELGEVGLMSTEMIQRRHYTAGESGLKYLQRRLREFAQAGLLESIGVTLNETSRQGCKRGNRPRKLPHTHRLTLVGAHEIEQLTGRFPARPARSDPPGPALLLHRLGVVATRLAIDDACRLAGIEAPSWIMEHDIRPGSSPTDRYGDRYILYDAFGRGETRVVSRPDAAMLLKIPNGDGWHLAGYLEYCRGTDKREQIISKMAAFATLFHPKRQHFRKHWPAIERIAPRILFVCTTDARHAQLLDWLRGQPAHNLVRVAVATALVPGQLLNDPIWTDTRGRQRAIMAPKAD